MRKRLFPSCVLFLVFVMAQVPGLAQGSAPDSQKKVEIQRLRKAVAQNPTNVQMRLELADLLAQSGDHDAAIAELRESVRVRPDDPELYNMLGAALLNRKIGRAHV